MNDVSLSQISGKPKMLLFDTNFIRPLLKGSFHHRMDDLESDLRTAIRSPFRPWRTAFSFMEWIGLNSESLPKPLPFDPTTVVGTNFIEPAYRHYEAHYNKVSELDFANLRHLADRQTDHVCPRVLDIWEAMLGGIFSDGDASSWLRFTLAFDAVHKLEIPQSHRSRYWSNLISGGFFTADHHTRNLSKFRLAYKMWRQKAEQLTARGAPPNHKLCIEDIQRLLNLGNWKDYLDGDLVHIAALGVEDRDGARHRITCLTCDKPEVIIMRIRLYKGLLSYVRKLYRKAADIEGAPIDYESSHNGEVLCFDQSGNLIRRIDVATETPALPFLGKEPL
jgi:hypothetical protein